MDRLEEIRQRWTEATPGPWESFSHLANIAHRVKGPPYTKALPRCEGGYRWYARQEDAEAIAAAPADIEWLVAEVERLRAALPRFPGSQLLLREDKADD